MQQKIYLGKIAESIANINGCSTSVAESFVKALCALISDELQKGHSVKIKGLGIFSLTGDSTNPVALELDKEIINSINLPFAFFDSVELDEELTEELFEQELKQLDVETTYNLSEENTEEDNSNADEVTSDVSNIDLIDEKDINNDALIKAENDIDEVQNQQDLQSNVGTVNEEVDSCCNNKQEVGVEDCQANMEDCISNNCEKKDYNKTNISHIFTFIIALLIGLIMGFIGGIYTKSFIDNDTLIKQINEQKTILDSLVSNKNVSAQSIDTVKRDTSTSASTTRVDSINMVKDDLNKETKYQTDKVTSKRYLTTMSREYYGNFNFWVYIYEENKSKLGNPNAIRPGTIVVIPPPSKYGIDANNPQSIEIAKQKAIEIYSKYTN